MPGRLHHLITGQIYHIYNKTINDNSLFNNDFYCQKFIDDIWYYRSSASLIRLSNLDKISNEFKESYLKKINDPNFFRVSILTHTLMPTHYHFILKQNRDNGISNFISLIQNSFTRFYNIKNSSNGPVFLHRFKSKPIITEEQLKHTSRYIHLNPYSSGLIKSVKNLEKYPWSSYKEYINRLKNILPEPDYILFLFNNDRERYKKFVINNADYQKTLEICKYAEK